MSTRLRATFLVLCHGGVALCLGVRLCGAAIVADRRSVSRSVPVKWSGLPPLCVRSSATTNNQVETEQRLPPELVDEFRAAGFYSLVMPRSMGGLQADPMTYLA
jgi:alkylation response protein AidB-like acyl-CoA dehydrogenase